MEKSGMGVIECDECGAIVIDKATACTKCGAPPNTGMVPLARAGGKVITTQQTSYIHDWEFSRAH
jgi:uncharacterized OB-fold protein